MSRRASPRVEGKRETTMRSPKARARARITRVEIGMVPMMRTRRCTEAEAKKEAKEVTEVHITTTMAAQRERARVKEKHPVGTTTARGERWCIGGKLDRGAKAGNALVLDALSIDENVYIQHVRGAVTIGHYPHCRHYQCCTRPGTSLSYVG